MDPLGSDYGYESGNAQLIVAHQQYVADLSSYYTDSAMGRGKDIFGFDKPLPPLPPNVPYNDGLFAIYVASFVTLAIFAVAIKLVYDIFIVAYYSSNTPSPKTSTSTSSASTSSSTLPTPRALLIRVVLLIIGFWFVSVAVGYAQSLKDINYQLLGFDSSNTSAITSDDIKQAWRQKALQFHPDKQQSSDGGQEEFMRIAKAYKTLLRMHGAGDDSEGGDTSSFYPLLVALPTWLQQTENYQWVVSIYFGILFLVVPIFMLIARSSLITSSMEEKLQYLLSYEMNRAPRTDIDYFDSSDSDDENGVGGDDDGNSGSDDGGNSGSDD